MRPREYTDTKMRAICGLMLEGETVQQNQDSAGISLSDFRMAHCCCSTSAVLAIKSRSAFRVDTTDIVSPFMSLYLLVPLEALITRRTTTRLPYLEIHQLMSGTYSR